MGRLRGIGVAQTPDLPRVCFDTNVARRLRGAASIKEASMTKSILFFGLVGAFFASGCGGAPAEDSQGTSEAGQTADGRNPTKWHRILACGTYSAAENTPWIDLDV